VKPAPDEDTLRRRRWIIDGVIVTVAIAAAVTVALVARDTEANGPSLLDIPVGLLSLVLVVGRRHRTGLLLALSTFGTAALAVLEDRPGLLLLSTLVLLFTYATQVERRGAIIAGLLTAVVLYGSAVSTSRVPLRSPAVVIVFAWCSVAVAAGDAVRSWRAARLAAAERTERRIVEERLAIARELHDLLAHNLSVMNVQTGVASHLLRSDIDRAEDALRLARSAGRSMLDELRGMLAVLRSPDAPVDVLPGVTEIPALVETMRSTGLAVSAHLPTTWPSVSPVVSLTAYRVVQESLTNALRHGAGSAELTITADDDGLAITVTNPVRGTNVPSVSGHGLTGMRERVASVDGSLDVRSAGGRFEVVARLPVLASAPVS
jgi:signal transduction histidine kinase